MALPRVPITRPTLQITKIDAAWRQLSTAIQLYFHDGDPVSVHTLAAAALGVLGDLVRARNIDYKTFVEHARERVKPEYRKEFIGAMRQPQNFFKHANRDDGGVLENYTPEQVQWLLLDGCLAYEAVTTERPAVIGVLFLWAKLTFAETVFEYPEANGPYDIDPLLMGRLATLSKGAFFAEVLPAMIASIHRTDMTNR